MTKKKVIKSCSDWDVMLSHLEVEMRRTLGYERNETRSYVVALRTMERLGAKRSDNFTDRGTSKKAEALFNAEFNKSREEWSEYLRLKDIFAPHIHRYEGIKYPDPLEDFHAAWVKAGGEKFYA